MQKWAIGTIFNDFFQKGFAKKKKGCTFAPRMGYLCTEIGE